MGNKEGLLKIINHYGLNNQLRKLQEEVFELNEAITIENNSGCLEQGIRTLLKIASAFQKEKSIDWRKENVKEELVDVMVVLKQIQLFYEIEDKEIEEGMNYKTERQLNRMEVEKSVGRN